MTILFPINEIAPLYKLGGLGDVGRSLPLALTRLGLDVRLIIPFHPELKTQIKQKLLVCRSQLIYNHQKLSFSLYLTQLPGTFIPIYLIDEPNYISTPSSVDDHYPDKYAVFCLAICTLLAHDSVFQSCNLVHCHDWHTALIPLLIKHQFKLPLKTILTIHNLAYQGDTSQPLLARLGLNPATCQSLLTLTPSSHNLNPLLQGILHADHLTTVSPTYAQEILTPSYGCSLDQFLESKRHSLTGILNGIDLNFFNPLTDPLIDTHYSNQNLFSGKLSNKQALFHSLSLPENKQPLVAYIGRIDPKQKGIDLICQYLKSRSEFPPHPFIFLGTGDPQFETNLKQLAQTQKSVRIFTQFNEPLAHKLYAAADMLLIPSTYEPCGLIQMIAMRYGTIPIAHATGGLKDSITHQQTGFLYTPNLYPHLKTALNQGFRLFTQKPLWQSMVHRAMAVDFSWDRSALSYQKLYFQLLSRSTNEKLTIKQTLS